MPDRQTRATSRRPAAAPGGGRPARPRLRAGRPSGLLLLLLAAGAAVTSPLGAQAPRAGGAAEVFAGGELERYLRTLQVTGRSALYPWSIRGFSPQEVDRLAPADSAHPWAGRYRIGFAGRGAWQVDVVAPRARAVYNSAFPFATDHGTVWAGRGLTTELSAGIAARLGPLSLVVAPVASWTQNAEFEIAEHRFSDRFPFADARFPEFIDLPQRFGDGSFQRLDPGQTTLRADALGLTVGLSNAHQTWGPTDEYPILLGVNAPGFVHGFAGSSRPWNVGIGRAHGRLMWGRLEQSDFATVPADSASRFTTGIVGVFSPRGIPGLEVGGARFFHMPWPDNGFGRTQLLTPLETFLKENLLDQDLSELEASVVSNQLASIFGRWVFPRSGLEVYGEFASEDHRHNLRDLILQPDHANAFTVGLRKVWELEGPRLLGVRAEVLGASPSHLHRTRRQETFYIHASTRQGHTQRGQILGSPAAFGGGASTLEVDYYHQGGRVSVALRRMVRQELGQYLETGRRDHPDVVHAVGAEMLLFRGRLDVTTGLTGAFNVNRNFRGNVLNLNGVLGVRAAL